MKIQIEHTVAGSVSGKNETYRITVRSASYVDRAHYFALAREAGDWYVQRTGLQLEDETDEAEFIALRNLCFFRAEMLCVIDRERTSNGIVYQCNYRNGTLDAKWQRKSLPADWVSLDGMADLLPTGLFDEWLAATRELNAGVLPTVPERFLAQPLTTKLVIDN
ncbi:MAG: hypothetical protein DDT21_01840 [Syntrophomonadaceae bacterium]|nr:hypothetical protein [Bacillota bacterium]